MGVTAELGVTALQQYDKSEVIVNNQDSRRAQLTRLMRSNSVWRPGLTWDRKKRNIVKQLSEVRFITFGEFDSVDKTNL